MHRWSSSPHFAATAAARLSTAVVVVSHRSLGTSSSCFSRPISFSKRAAMIPPSSSWKSTEWHFTRPHSSSSLPPPPRRNFGSASSTSSSGHRRNKQYYKLRKHKKDAEACPFKTLGVAPGVKYREARKAFLDLALKHHPDTAAAETDDEREHHRTRFVEIRRALERLAPGGGPDGTLAILVEDAPQHQPAESDTDLDEWFKRETGYDMPFLDAKTIREVAEMTETVGHGLDRDGGMWTLAQMVADSVKSGAGDGNAQSLLRLEAGDAKDRSHIDGILRRRRRR